MTRFITTLLLLALLVFGIESFITAHQYGWWLPEMVSSYGGAIDNLFYLILGMVTFFFILTEGLLIWCVFVYSGKRDTKATFSHGNHKLELLWTAIPAVLLLVIAFSQMSTFAEIRFDSAFEKEGRQEPIARVWAAQFDWHFQYPGRDGVFDTADDIDRPFEFIVPVGQDVRFDLRSRDVIHSFFVPQFRIKQDAMPGMQVPVWFHATKEGVYDLICAELCGWGHYKMAGKIHVLEQDDYEQWLEDQRAALYTNGEED